MRRFLRPLGLALSILFLGACGTALASPSGKSQGSPKAPSPNSQKLPPLIGPPLPPGMHPVPPFTLPDRIEYPFGDSGEAAGDAQDEGDDEEELDLDALPDVDADDPEIQRLQNQAIPGLSEKLRGIEEKLGALIDAFLGSRAGASAHDQIEEIEKDYARDAAENRQRWERDSNAIQTNDPDEARRLQREIDADLLERETQRRVGLDREIDQVLRAELPPKLLSEYQDLTTERDGARRSLLDAEQELDLLRSE